MSVVRLTNDDWDQASSLAKKGNSFCGVPSGTTEVSLQYLKDAYLDGTFGYEAYGDKMEGTLRSLALVHRSRYQPCFFVTRVYSWSADPSSDTLHALIANLPYRMCLEHKLTRWYAVNPMWNAQFTGVSESSPELIVPPHTRPPYSEFFNILMARQIWPEELRIQRYVSQGY